MHPLFVLLGSAIGGRHLITEPIVFIAKTLRLLLEGLDVLVFLFELSFQLSNLSHAPSLAEFLGALARCVRVTLEALVFFFEAQDVDNHDIGAVEDKRQEESEAAEVHVALRVEFTSLHFAALRAKNHGTAMIFVSAYHAGNQGVLRLPSGPALLTRRREFDLHTVDPVDRVHKQNENEDKDNLGHKESVA